VEITQAAKELYEATGKSLSGSARRLFMARTVKALGRGGKEWAQRELGWSGVTIRKGIHELESGIACVDAYDMRGRKRAEAHLPNLLEDIRAIVDGQSQTDASFKSTRLYTRMTAKETRKQLIEQKKYSDEELPCEDVIRERLNEMGYRVRAVGKSKPKKR
jgi:Rhodopirellula transposase DDE domain